MWQSCMYDQYDQYALRLTQRIRRHNLALIQNSKYFLRQFEKRNLPINERVKHKVYIQKFQLRNYILCSFYPMRTRNFLSDPRGITQVWTDWPPSGSESSRGWFAKGGGTSENMSPLVRGNESWYDCTNANAKRNDRSIKSIDSLFSQKTKKNDRSIKFIDNLFSEK